MLFQKKKKSMEQHVKHDEQQPLNLNKGNKDPKGQEDKPPPAKLKKYNPTPLAAIPEKNEWRNLD